MKKPYVPKNLPLESLDWISLIELIGSANAELARYDGTLQGIINPKVLLSPLSTKEAVVSSKIEGTQATLEEVLEYEASPNKKTEKYNDIQEIINYRKSTQFAVEWLKSKPITLNLIKGIHSILLDSVRGRDKSRGNFRKIQNWIGKPGTPMQQAIYIPPNPLFLMNYLSNFEKYIHYDEKDRLIQLAVIHAQFEIIHPFLDGNGRLGRILIPLFLFEKNILHSPMFYMSEYFEKNRDEYYAKLNGITNENKWEEWIEFFLKAIIEQSKINSIKAKSVLDLYNQKKEIITHITKSPHSIKVLDTLFLSPIFSTKDFIKHSKIPKATALRLLDKLKNKGILSIVKKGGGRASEVLIFNKLLKIIDT